jgi:ABC-type multidrug transport system fused ATPase/permease subunit
MSDGTDDGTEDTMSQLASESRVKLWMLMRGNRLHVTGLLTGAVFIVFVISVTTLNPPFAQQIASGDPIDTMFTTMITVVVTGTTLVVTIGQLVLSQENGPLGDQRERMTNTMDFREFASEITGAPSSAYPAEFLGELLDATEQRATKLREAVDENVDPTLRAEVEEFTETVAENAKSVSEQLDSAQFGSFEVMFAALKFNYSLKIFQAERIADEYEEDLREADLALLADLKTALSMFGPAREHIKTLYFQWALINLSQLILYVAVPALTVAAIMVATVDAGTVPGETLGIDHIVLAVGGAFAVTVVPFMLFVSYILRVLTIAKQTLAIGPLVLRGSEK